MHPLALDVLRAEAELLEAEVALLAAERDAGALVDGKRRPFEHELRAGVRFAQLDRDVLDTAAAAAKRAAAVRDQLVDDLAAVALEGAGDDPLAALERIRGLADPTRPDVLPGTREAIDAAAADLERDLVRLAERSSDELLAEARRQGLTDLPRVELDPADRRAITAAARRVAEQPLTHGLAVAVEGAERLAPGAEDGAEVLFGALEAVEEAKTAALDDVARQAAGGAQGIGRTRAARLVPRPARVYASELLDGNTCGPCETVDGREYDTLEHALEDYPGAGGFVFCEGGGRCRGTLVYVWATEEPATGGGIPPQQGPSDPPGGPDGPIRPIPADDRRSFPRAFEPPVPPPLPSAPLPATTPPAVDPADVTLDPELVELGDGVVEARLREAMRDGDTAGAVRLADELDRRAALGSAWRDPDLDESWDVGPDLTPEELDAEAARIAAGMEEAAPDLADLGVGAGPGATSGRRIDRVRADYEAEQYRRMMAAEAEGAEGIRADRREEFDRKYGTGPGAGMELLWFGPAHRAYYYASEELRAYWQQHGRTSFAEYAVKAGITDAKTVARAKAAQRADADARQRAEESGTDRDVERRRQRQAEARKRRATGPGAELERARRRMEREQRRAAKLERDLERQGATVERAPDFDGPPPRILDEEPDRPPVDDPDPDNDTVGEPFLEDVPVPPEPPRIRTWEDGEAWASTHGIRITDKARAEVDPEVFEVFAKVYEEAVRRYPQVAGRVVEFDRVVANSPGVAASVGPAHPQGWARGDTFDVRVGVTTARLPSEERLRAATKVLGLSPYDLIVHEFGHVVQASSPRLWAKSKEDARRIGYEESILDEALKSSTVGYGGRGKASKAEVSIYANTNPLEFFAEAFLAFWRGDVDAMDADDPKRKRLERYRDFVNERVGMRAIG